MDTRRLRCPLKTTSEFKSITEVGRQIASPNSASAVLKTARRLKVKSAVGGQRLALILIRRRPLDQDTYGTIGDQHPFMVAHLCPET